jgi:hypothetical protein
MRTNVFLDSFEMFARSTVSRLGTTRVITTLRLEDTQVPPFHSSQNWGLAYGPIERTPPIAIELLCASATTLLLNVMTMTLTLAI